MSGISNNGYITIDSIKYLNNFMWRLENIKPQDIEKIYSDNGFNYIRRSYKKTKLSNMAILNKNSVSNIRKTIEYMRNTLTRIHTISGKIDLSEEVVTNVSADGNTNFAASLKSKLIQIPENYDGNYSFIKFFIDKEQLIKTNFAISKSPELALPGVFLSYNSFFSIYTFFNCLPEFKIDNPLSFYSYQSGKGHIQIEYSKSKDSIILYYGSDNIKWEETNFNKKVLSLKMEQTPNINLDIDISVLPIINYEIELYRTGV